jgi:hypothetical protein
MSWIAVTPLLPQNGKRHDTKWQKSCGVGSHSIEDKVPLAQLCRFWQVVLAKKKNPAVRPTSKANFFSHMFDSC